MNDAPATERNVVRSLSNAGLAATVLTKAGVFNGAHGLDGLLNAQGFWEQQPYGTRLYYGDGTADYLHRDVLREAVRALTDNGIEKS